MHPDSNLVSQSGKEKLKDIKAILFDMDGVLFISNEIHAKAYKMAFEKEEIHDFCHTEISGMRTDEVVDIVLTRNKRDNSPSEIDRVTQSKRDFAKQLFLDDAPVIDGCADLLKTLHKSFRLALATSASKHTADTFLAIDNMRQYFDFVICGPEVDKSKPHPEIYQRAMQALDATPEECLVIEDSINGVQAGIAAGAHVIGVEGTIEPPDLRHAGAFHVMKKTINLKDILVSL